MTAGSASDGWQEGQGRVIAVAAEGVWIEASRKTACSRCAEGRGCGANVLGDWFGRRPVRLFIPLAAGVGGAGGTGEASATLGGLGRGSAAPQGLSPVVLSEGTWIRFAVSDRSLAGAALMVYLPPLLGLVLGAILGAQAAALLLLPGDAGAVLGGLTGLAAGLFGGGHWGRRTVLSSLVPRYLGPVGSPFCPPPS